MTKRFTYLDNNATTPLAPEVTRGIADASLEFGNPSSIHWAGRGPKQILRETRQKLAELYRVSATEIIFNSGASEGNNTVIRSVLEAIRLGKLAGRTEFVTTQIEHPSVLNSFRYVESLGFKVHYLPVNLKGELDFALASQVISEKTALVSAMFANNETGLMLPVHKLCGLAKSKGALFHTDAVQSLGKAEINFADLPADYASFSAHKFYALKGCGFLFVRRGSPYESLILGGSQERRRRGGTENSLGIWSVSQVVSKLENLIPESHRLRTLRDRFEAHLMAEIPALTITHQKAARLGNTSSILIEGIDGESLLMALDVQGFAVSTGAACASGSPEPSPVLLALGLSRQQAQSSLRISLGWHNTQEDLDRLLVALKTSVERLRGLKKCSERELHV